MDMVFCIKGDAAGMRGIEVHSLEALAATVDTQLGEDLKSLEDLVGVAWVPGPDEQPVAERSLTPAEKVEAIGRFFADRGESFQGFDAGSAAERAAFVSEAGKFGLKDVALLAVSETLGHSLVDQALAAGVSLDRDDVASLLGGDLDFPVNHRYEGLVKVLDERAGVAVVDVGRGNGKAVLLESVDKPLVLDQMVTIDFKDGQGTVVDRELGKGRGMER